MNRRVTLVDGVVFEEVGHDLLVLLPDSTAVKLSGPAADVVREVAEGNDLSDIDESVVAELVHAGVVRSDAGVTRRHLVKLGAVATGAGVASLALPSVAAANSVELLSGTWYWYPFDVLFPTEDYEEPTWSRWFRVVLDDDFVLPGGSPSPLSVLGLNVPFGQQVDMNNEPVPAGSDGFLDYLVVVSPGGPAVAKSAPLTGNLVGRFSWDGVTYQVTFEQEPDAEPGPTAVSGTWDVVGGSVSISIPLLGENRSNTGNPTDMAVEGLTGPVPWDTFVGGIPGGKWERLLGVDESVPSVNVPITATFTWDEEEFEATLTYDGVPG